jgi:hypothetical protein
MNNEHEKQVEQDFLGEESFIESIGMLQLLVEHGKKLGLCHFHRPVYLLIVASRDFNLWW